MRGTVFNDLDIMLNPRLNYEGSSCFHANTLLLAQKGDELTKYFHTIYFAPMEAALKSAYLPESFINLIFSNDPVENGRVTVLEGTLVLDQYAYSLLGKHLPNLEDITVDEAVSWIREETRNLRKQLRLSKEGNGELPEFLKDSLMVSVMLSSDKKQSKIDFYEAYSEVLTDFAVGIKYIAPILNKPLDLAEIVKRVDVDKCLLSLGKAFLDNSEFAEEQSGQLHNCFSIALTYARVMEDAIKGCPDYKLKSDVADMYGKKIHGYSFQTFVREINALIARHPEFKIVQIITPDADEYRNFDKAMELVSRYENADKVKALSGSWEFIPKGVDLDGHSEPIEPPRPRPKKPHVEGEDSGKMTLSDLTEEELLYYAQLRDNYLIGTPYLYKLKGKNNFEGYIGYIYPNGIVIFEKFYESINPLIPAKSNATYIMNIDNFIEMSRKSKPDIIEYIKSGASDARRIYHSIVPGKWESKINTVISGRGYSDETLKIIDELLQNGLLNEETENIGTGGRK